MSASSRICTKPFHVRGLNLDVKEGDPLRITRIAVQSDRATVHFGGMLVADMSLRELIGCSREAEPNELKKELRHCARCDKIEVSAGRWMPKPPCFNPREGVTLVAHNCPKCDV